MQKERIEYLDAIKGFAIFLMVMAHAIAWNYSDYNIICIYNPGQPINIKMGGIVWQLIYSFHMPLFFMISGFLSYKIYEWKDFSIFFKKKVIRLFIPWISSFAIIYFIRESMGYWFLLCLFEISIMSFILITLLQKINKNTNLVIDILIISLPYIIFKYFDVWNWNVYGIEIGRFANAYLPFFTGVFLRRHRILFSICIKRNFFYTCALILFCLIFVTRYWVNENLVCKLVYNLGFTILPIIGSLLFFHAFEHGFLKKMWPILTYLGTKTLPIYILHILFVIQLDEVGYYILEQTATTSITIQVLYSSSISIVAIMLSLITYKIIYRSILLRKLLFGE